MAEGPVGPHSLWVRSMRHVRQWEAHVPHGVWDFERAELSGLHHREIVLAGQVEEFLAQLRLYLAEQAVVLHLLQQVAWLAAAERTIHLLIVRVDEVIDWLIVVVESESAAHHLHEIAELRLGRVDDLDLVRNT